MKLLPTLALGALVLGACGSRHSSTKTPEPEYSDEAEYANTPTHGPASESSSGYYGVGSSGAPERTPAQPSGRCFEQWVYRDSNPGPAD